MIDIIYDSLVALLLLVFTLTVAAAGVLLVVAGYPDLGPFAWFGGICALIGAAGLFVGFIEFAGDIIDDIRSR